jgi:hypothetical protein
MNKQKNLWLMIALLFSMPIFAHVGGHEDFNGEIFYLNGKPIEGHFLMTKNEKIFGTIYYLSQSPKMPIFVL